MNQEIAKLAVIPSNAVIDFANKDIIRTIKETVARGASDSQFALFTEVCKATGLNPFLKEIWLIPKTNTIMASRDGYLRKANENPQFDGMETRVERDKNNIPVKATCTVWRKDRGHPITCEAYYNEYRKESPVWKQYPSAMISKVAEVLALKRSFAINGVVTEEEIGNAAEFKNPVVQDGGISDSPPPKPANKKTNPKVDKIKGQEAIRKLIEENAGKGSFIDSSKDDLMQIAFDEPDAAIDHLNDYADVKYLRVAYKRLNTYIKSVKGE